MAILISVNETIEEVSSFQTNPCIVWASFEQWLQLLRADFLRSFRRKRRTISEVELWNSLLASYTAHIDRFQISTKPYYRIYLPSQNRKRRWFGSPAHRCPKWAWAVGITGAKHLGTQRYEALVEKRGMFLQPSNMVEIHCVFFGLAVPVLPHLSFISSPACWNIGSKMM